MARTVDLAGLRLAITCRDLSLSTYVDWQLGALLDASGPPELTLNVGLNPPARPAALTQWKVDGPVTFHDAGDGVSYCTHDEGGAALIRGNDMTVGVTAAANKQWRVLRQLVFTALSEAIDARGLMWLHAAMISRDGGSLLVLGGPGRGKSTAAVAALRGAWKLHGDDAAILRRDGDGVAAFAVPRRPMISSELAGGIPGEALPLPDDDRRRVLMSSTLLEPGWRPVRALVLVHHDEGTGRFERHPEGIGLAAIMRSFAQTGRPASLKRQLPTMAAVATLPAYQLDHAADPACRLARAAELLEAIWSDVTVNNC